MLFLPFFTHQMKNILNEAWIICNMWFIYSGIIWVTVFLYVGTVMLLCYKKTPWATLLSSVTPLSFFVDWCLVLKQHPGNELHLPRCQLITYFGQQNTYCDHHIGKAFSALTWITRQLWITNDPTDVAFTLCVYTRMACFNAPTYWLLYT